MGRRAEGRDRRLISREEDRSQSVDRSPGASPRSVMVSLAMITAARWADTWSVSAASSATGPSAARIRYGRPGTRSPTGREEAVVSDGTAELFGTLAEIPEACTAAEAVTTVGSVKVDGTIATVRVTDSSAPSTRRTRRRPSARSSWTRAPAAVHWAPVTTTTYSWTGADQWAAFGRGERPDLFRQCQVSRVPTRTPRLPTVHGLVPPACP